MDVGYLLQEVSAAGVEPTLISDNGSVVQFETVLQDTKPNRNKRIYSESLLAEATQAPRFQELLRTRTLYGEANHPFDSDLKRQMVIDHRRVSHLITEVSRPINGVMTGKVETAATAAGRDMRGLLVENKSQMAFSMRGMGKVRSSKVGGIMEVVSPFLILTYDWVTYPSHQAAYMADGGRAAVTRTAAESFAMDQSDNVRAIVEQFELDAPELTITEDQASVILQSGKETMMVFLEKDIRQEFKACLRSMYG